MPATAQPPGVTFSVDWVTPASKPLPECRLHEGLRQLLGSDLESCCDYHSMAIAGVGYHPLLDAVHTAFSQHRPLVLSPDAVWITIAQGVAHHMALHAERLRSRFVAHADRLGLVFECADWVGGSPENPWPEAFAGWTAQIRDHVGPRVYEALVCDFSTTGPTELAASQVVLMDVFERYFHYYAYCICGIPSVTLEGTPADWQRLADKAAALRGFDLDWWLKHLLPICDEFVRASRGKARRRHWKDICKLRSEYGGDVINGWIVKLFPYVRAYIGGPCTRLNPIFDTGRGIKSYDVPSGLSRVPFTWRNRGERSMEAIGGVIGVTQDPTTLALRPKVGWAVRAAGTLDALLERVVAGHCTCAGYRGKVEYTTPPDLAAFHHRTNGATLFGTACRIVPAEAVEPLDWGEAPEAGGNSRGPGGRIWQRFAWLADGSWLAVNMDMNRHLAPWWKDPELRAQGDARDRVFAPICHGTAASQGKAGANPVVALSFTELLERLLAASGRPYWLEPQFTAYGDAAQFTR